jgi:3D (Asp-Asp-Asp) domain-containing protein
LEQFTPEFRHAEFIRTIMKHFIIATGLVLFCACPAFARERSLLARVTVYWHNEGSGERACSNGRRLRNGHCAVDPKKIPYGSKVVFPDASCVAVDSGPAVVNRKAARLCGRTASERSALVVDRFFESKQEALSWAKAHPHFMTLRILSPEQNAGSRQDSAAKTKNLAFNGIVAEKS